MRIFARRERPHPGAQLSLFETADGWRYSLRAANLPAGTRGWRGQGACADAAHRVHARVEDVIRAGKDTGLGHFPSRDYGLNASWLDAAMTGCILLACVFGDVGAFPTSSYENTDYFVDASFTPSGG